MASATCVTCESEFEIPPGRGRASKTCSAICKAERDAELGRARQSEYGACDAEGCEKSRRSAGARWCEMHYGRLRRRVKGVKPRRPYTGLCYHCGAPAKRARYYCDDLCVRRARMGAEGRLLTCVMCDATLVESVRLDTLYCGKACSDAAARARRYGLTNAQAAVLFRDARCGICESPNDLHIDHDHGTGRVRGLLCGTCNVGLGMFHESSAKLLSALAYLERHVLEDFESQEASAPELVGTPSGMSAA